MSRPSRFNALFAFVPVFLASAVPQPHAGAQITTSRQAAIRGGCFKRTASEHPYQLLEKTSVFEAVALQREGIWFSVATTTSSAESNAA